MQVSQRAMARNLNGGHGGEAPDPLTIFAEETARSVLAAGISVAGDTSSQNNAGGQPLYVPLPWAALGFVEIIDVELSLRAGRATEAEVLAVRVTAHLNFNFAVRALAQIGSHDLH